MGGLAFVSVPVCGPTRSVALPQGILYFLESLKQRQTSMRVLVLEDDPKIASFLEKGLTQSGFAVDVCEDGEEGLVRVTSTDYDAAIMDRMLPGMDGLEIIRRMRLNGLQTPVLILSAKASVDDRIEGLQAGGDDYLTKPFSFSELLARVHALIRRSSQAKEPTRLEWQDIQMDLLTREVSVGAQKIDLQPKEFALLEYLIRQKERVVTKTMILEHIWNYHFDPQTNVVDVLVSRLRNKVDVDRTRIHTIRGVGYALRRP